jgi:hypothetical protein
VSSDIKLGWRDETVGSSLSIRTETRTLEVQAEPDFKEQSRRIETHELVVDFDRYTAKPLQLEQFRAVEWLSGFNRLISKDLTSLLEADENTR